MATCAYCSTTIVFGGKKDGDLRFCNAQCQQHGILVQAANQLPDQQVDHYVASVHGGACPRCSGDGPVDVHTSYRVHSAILYTSWSSRPAICCKRCGTKRKIGDTAFSVFLGWWGIPWGPLVTPVQIVRNVAGFFRTPDPAQPSPALKRMLRLHLAERALQGE